MSDADLPGPAAVSHAFLFSATLASREPTFDKDSGHEIHTGSPFGFFTVYEVSCELPPKWRGLVQRVFASSTGVHDRVVWRTVLELMADRWLELPVSPMDWSELWRACVTNWSPPVGVADAWPQAPIILYLEPAARLSDVGDWRQLAELSRRYVRQENSVCVPTVLEDCVLLPGPGPWYPGRTTTVASQGPVG
jgi:hypothetical protein